MKKSLRRKLIMSAVAVGAAAVGTTASTYAWFVSNSNVSANGVQGSVVDADANLYIENGGNYGTSATVTAGGDALKPIAIKANKFVDSNGDQVTGTPYATFELKFKATGIAQDKTYALNISSISAADTAPSKSYTPVADAGTGIKKGTPISGDVTESLVLSYYEGESITPTASNSLALNNTGTTTSSEGKAYYTAVTGKNPLADCTAITSGFNKDGKNATSDNGFTIKNISYSDTTDGTLDFTVKFIVWLNGDDDQCFDVIASHTWNLSLTFALKDTSSLAA